MCISPDLRHASVLPHGSTNGHRTGETAILAERDFMTPSRERAAGRDRDEAAGRLFYSQPASLAMRAASTRLRAPNLVTAAAR
jgi:hypothetical protein